MNNDHPPNDLCAEVDDRLADILEGEADERILDHIADCDRCRDARHDAECAQRQVREAGADYLPPPDLEARVLEAFDRGEVPEPLSTMVSSTERAPALAEPPRTAEAAVAIAKTVSLEAVPVPVTPSADSTRSGPSLAAQSTERSLDAVSAPEPSKQQTPRESPPAPPQKDAPGRPDQPAAKAARLYDRLASLTSGKRRALIGGGAAVAALAAAVAFYAGRSSDNGSSDEESAWRGKVVRVSSAGGGTKGLELCDPSGKSCAGLGAEGSVPAGSLLRTDDRTRAAVLLDDGTSLSLDRGSELWLSAEGARRARLGKGAIVADVAHSKDQIARIELPRGHLEVLGTKFALRTSSDSAAVEVSRGTVRLVDEQNRAVTVRAGEEGRAYAGMPPYVGATSSLGAALAWSEAAIAEPGEEIAARGLGELKAKKPSSNQELSQAVTLTSHSVKVRIAGAVARTEVDETFTNHTGDVLEGIFRFPLPPDAKIERLALEVDGKLEEGAFVDRDRAAAIWRGAIVNAAPEQRRQIREEIVWVPGPWRDPALLEWQRGGRFELRIYPIPKRGARRVILAYTQLIQPTGGVRRYSYPLAHDPSGSTKVSSFGVELQVRGHDEKFGVRSQGYELARSSAGGADVLSMSAREFTPAGDLTVEYALPDRDAELAVWSYKPSAEELAKAASKPAVPAKAGAAPAEPSSASLSNDPFVALALRPKLPRAGDDAHRSFVLVVDSSRSMFGESYKRASRLATRILRELDPLDRVTLLACDTECRALPSGLQPPSAQLAVEADRFLSGISPEGASDPSAAVASAVRAAADGNGRALRVIYVGDGMPTVGPIRPAWVARAVERALPPERGSVTAVAIGADSDLDTLSALARGGGGVVLPYVPGQTTAEATYAVLGASYGNALRDVRVELPDGLSEVAPKQLDTLPAGGESLLVARLSKPEVSGTVVLRGKLGKQPFEQRYPVRILPSAAKGNAFVPRLYAATRIADLERETSADAKKRAVELSQAYNVASRYTSLLVLESAAMFKAFGLDNTRRAPEWSGEDAAEVATASGELEVGADKDDAVAGPLAATGGGAAPAAKRAASPADEGFGLGTLGRGAGATATPTAEPKPSPASAAPPAPPRISEEAKKEASADERESARAKAPARRPPLAEPIAPNAFESSRGRPRNWIPMRRIFERVGSVISDRFVPRAITRSAIANAEAALDRDQNRRELVRKLYTLHALSGDIGQSSTLAERWSSKEPLDPDALTARADVAARLGDRALAIRILGSVVDVRPGDVKAQKRLARLQRWAGRPELGCRHALAISQLHTSDALLLAEAVRCARQTAESELANELFSAADEKTRKAAEVRLAKAEPGDALSGDLRLEARWGGAQDVDLALIDPDGNRISWLGAPTRAVISARDVTSFNNESLALRGGKAGEYVIEVVRARGNGPARGEVVVSVAGARRTLPFVLDGVRMTLGVARIDVEPRLVPFR